MKHEFVPEDENKIRLASSTPPPTNMEIDSTSGAHSKPAISSDTDPCIHLNSHAELKTPLQASANENTLIVSDDEIQVTNRRSRRSNAGKPAERLYEGDIYTEIDGLFSDADSVVKKESKTMKALKKSKISKTSQVTEKRAI